MAFGGLYTSISGLQATKYSLNTVSHNISNANNPNYVRQSALHTNTAYRQTGTEGMEVGTGVKIIEIRQIRDEFLDKKIRGEMPDFGYHYAKSEILEDVESVFNEITDSGLQKVMDDMWDNWNELYKEPESLTIRGLVHESAVAFTETVNRMSNQLNDIKQNLNRQISTKVGEVNDLLEGIANINKSIKVVEGEKTKIKANDYRDERNGLIDRLSQLIPVTIDENFYGETIISLQGKDLVNGSYTSKVELKMDSEGLAHMYWEKSNEMIDLGAKGEIGGFIDVRDKSMGEYMDRLDTLVGKMAEEINKIHNNGYDLEKNKGGDFFSGVIADSDGNYKNAAANIRVNPDLADLNKIAISSQKGVIGNGDIAKRIYEVRKDAIFGEMNPDDYYRDLVLNLSLERERSTLEVNNQGFLIKSLDEKRQGLSAVSLDEEMADMIRFQHAYSANSRVINTIDEMINTIIGMVGR